jgi:hypothetical protein
VAAQACSQLPAAASMLCFLGRVLHCRCHLSLTTCTAILHPCTVSSSRHIQLEAGSTMTSMHCMTYSLTALPDVLHCSVNAVLATQLTSHHGNWTWTPRLCLEPSTEARPHISTDQCQNVAVYGSQHASYGWASVMTHEEGRHQFGPCARHVAGWVPPPPLSQVLAAGRQQLDTCTRYRLYSNAVYVVLNQQVDKLLASM